MPTSKSRALAAAVLCLLHAEVTLAAPGPLEIRYREAWGYAVVVPVRIQGVGPVDFLLDTGTDVTVVRSDLARRLGLVPTARLSVASVAGERDLPRATLDPIELGGRALGPLDVVVHDMTAAVAADSRLAGILGQNALRNLAFTLDHQRRRVILDAPPLAGRAFPQGEGRPTLDAHLGCSGPRVRLTLDSGIGGLLLFEGATRLPLEPIGWTTATTNLGRIALRSGRLGALCIGDTRLHDVAVAVQPRREGATPPEDGLLPTRAFARVHFDGPRRQVRLEPWPP